jgi:hypothetical protein
MMLLWPCGSSFGSCPLRWWCVEMLSARHIARWTVQKSVSDWKRIQPRLHNSWAYPTQLIPSFFNWTTTANVFWQLALSPPHSLTQTPNELTSFWRKDNGIRAAAAAQHKIKPDCFLSEAKLAQLSAATTAPSQPRDSWLLSLHPHRLSCQIDG